MANFNVATYSPSDLVIEVAGYQVTGWVSVNISKQTASFQLVKGIRGKNTRIRNRDDSLTIQIAVQQTSLANDVFSEIVRQDRLYSTGKLTLRVSDPSGKYTAQSDSFFIEDYPTVSFTDNIETRTWTFHAEYMLEQSPGSGFNSDPFDFFSSSFEKIGKTVGEVSSAATDAVSGLFN
jgi:hypothetical protein